MLVVKRLKKAATAARVSTNVLSLVTGYSRSTIAYWFRSDEATRRTPRDYRLERLAVLATAIEAAHEAGDLPAEPQAAVLAIREWMKTATQ